MDNRKWEADAIVSPPTAPASPSDGYPTNGDPGAAQNATEPGAWWFHAIGEELRAVIIEGGLTPNISTLTQLRDAIKNIAKGGDYKESVRVASTAAINLAAPGANIDGVAMVAGNRFLEKDHATLASRGIYIWNGAAVAATRATDADTGAEFNGGAIIPVEEGTVNANTNWQMTNDGTVTIGTTGLTFQQVGIPADASETVKGVVELATNDEAKTGTDTARAVTPAGVAASSLGRGQTWQNLTGSRSSGVTYTNSTGKPIQVAVSVDSQAGTQYFVVDGVNILSWDNTAAEVNHGCVIVPNGSTYVVNATIIVHWAELR